MNTNNKKLSWNGGFQLVEHGYYTKLQNTHLLKNSNSLSIYPGLLQ